MFFSKESTRFVVPYETMSRKEKKTINIKRILLRVIGVICSLIFINLYISVNVTNANPHTGNGVIATQEPLKN